MSERHILEAASKLVAAFAANDGGVAIFYHEVATRLRIQGEETESRERETIVSRQQPEQGHWLACHEHLSAMPANLPPT